MKTRSVCSVLRSGSKQGAFTLIELLVVIAIVALLAATLLPALAGSQSRSQSLRCLDNLRQVMGAMLMYTHDNHDLFPPNPDDATQLYGYAWCEARAAGGMPTDTRAPSTATFNPDLLADPRICLITTYLNTNVTLFRCTADPRRGMYSGSNPALVGTIVPAARTISLSTAVGTIDPAFPGGHPGIPNLPTMGPWLDGTRYGNLSHFWRTYGKAADMVVPAPASLLVVIEEDPWSINDGLFGTCVGQPEWVDWPSTLHNMGCVVSFADGHVELHKWVDPSTRLTGPASTVYVPASAPDWKWVAQHSSARAY